MGTCAELIELALAEERYLLTLAGVLFDKLDFVGLALLLHHSNSLVGIELVSLERQSLFDYLLHLRLYFLENLGSERHIDIEIIIEAVVDSGTYRELRLGIEALDSLSEDVRSGMSERALSVIIVKSKNFELAVFIYLGAKILDLAVDAADARRLIESHAEALRHFHGGYSVVKLLDDSALEFNVYHKNFSFQLRAKARLRDEKSSTPRKNYRGEANAPRFHPVCGSRRHSCDLNAVIRRSLSRGGFGARSAAVTYPVSTPALSANGARLSLRTFGTRLLLHSF